MERNQTKTSITEWPVYGQWLRAVEDEETSGSGAPTLS